MVTPIFLPDITLITFPGKHNHSHIVFGVLPNTPYQGYSTFLFPFAFSYRYVLSPSLSDKLKIIPLNPGSVFATLSLTSLNMVHTS